MCASGFPPYAPQPLVLFWCWEEAWLDSRSLFVKIPFWGLWAAVVELLPELDSWGAVEDMVLERRVYEI
jgi:hypothetical protein